MLLTPENYVKKATYFDRLTTELGKLGFDTVVMFHENKPMYLGISKHFKKKVTASFLAKLKKLFGNDCDGCIFANE